jgi:hypothetical protein
MFGFDVGNELQKYNQSPRLFIKSFGKRANPSVICKKDTSTPGMARRANRTGYFSTCMD